MISEQTGVEAGRQDFRRHHQPYRIGRSSMTYIRKLLHSVRGATAIEYAMIAALIAVAAVGAMSALGEKLGGTFNSVNSKLG